MFETAILLDGAPNFRDFGGYAVADGRVVSRGKLFRSETMSMLTPQDFERIAPLGIRLVCDLRGPAEKEHQPTRWPEWHRPEVMHMNINAGLRLDSGDLIDILRRDTTVRGAEAVMLKSYRMIPAVAQPHLRDLFRRLAHDDVLPMVIHCTSGKDRTGVFTALIQLALGVSREDALADYMLTRRHQYLERFETTVAEVLTLSLGVKPPHDVVLAMADTRESYFNAAMQAIDEDYGTLDRYLVTAGIDDALLSRVKEHVLDSYSGVAK